MSWGAAWGPSWGGGGAAVAPPPLPDVTPPLISNCLPLPGVAIAKTDPVQCDVTDDQGFALIMVMARFPDGTCECLYDGIAFAPRYAAGSSKVVILDGFRFIMRRTGGWLGPTFDIEFVAVDTSCNITRFVVSFG